MSPEEKKAQQALAFIMPVLEKLGMRWVITGGFASYAHGVERPITDIDIDVEGSKDSALFQQLYQELTPHISQPLEKLEDQNYDNYNFEISVDGQVIDICPMEEMCVIDKASGNYLCFYADGFPAHEHVDFHGLRLPLLSKELIIKNKEMLAWQRKSDRRDIEGLKGLLEQ